MAGSGSLTCDAMSARACLLDGTSWACEAGRTGLEGGRASVYIEGCIQSICNVTCFD